MSNSDLSRQLDHIDTQLHELHQFIARYEPLIERFADPGKAVRGFLAGKGRGASGR